jgi:hypothetical protein
LLFLLSSVNKNKTGKIAAEKAFEFGSKLRKWRRDVNRKNGEILNSNSTVTADQYVRARGWAIHPERFSGKGA